LTAAGFRPERPHRATARLLLVPFSACLALCALAARSAENVRVLVDGRTLLVPGNTDTVRDALSEAHVSLEAEDEVSPALDASLADGGTIRVSRVTFTEGVTELKIPYHTVIRPATRGNRPYHPTVMKEGRTGIKRVTYRARLVDGWEVSRATLSEEVIREPENQVVVARKPQALGSRGAYIGRRTITVVATAYDPGLGSCGKYANGRTCNGKRAGYGIIAVDPKLIPLGAKLYVPGYGYGIAADVGGAIKGNHVDLGFNSRSGAVAWGKRQVKLKIVD
jgi:3D (Asp-Asp-Asp) domain-containing protein